MGVIRAICISEEKGTQKQPIDEALLLENFGIEGDAHAGNWHRQISLLSCEKVENFRESGAAVEDGAFGENILAEGIDFRNLQIGTILSCADSVLLEITQIGKECHQHCAIYEQIGDCIMPREGVFAKVIKGGKIKKGDKINVVE